MIAFVPYTHRFCLTRKWTNTKEPGYGENVIMSSHRKAYDITILCDWCVVCVCEKGGGCNTPVELCYVIFVSLKEWGVEQIVDVPVVWHIMTLIWSHGNAYFVRHSLRCVYGQIVRLSYFLFYLYIQFMGMCVCVCLAYPSLWWRLWEYLYSSWLSSDLKYD